MEHFFRLHLRSLRVVLHHDRNASRPHTLHIPVHKVNENGTLRKEEINEAILKSCFELNIHRYLENLCKHILILE
jgi:hypothetical protein